MSETTLYEHLSQLGSSTGLADSPEQTVLELVTNPHPDSQYLVRFTQPKFTSLCPKTVQPDFAHLAIGYASGGMPIDVIYQSGLTPQDLWLPDQSVQPNCGRG